VASEHARPDVAFEGLPGTGKTTTLLEVLEDELEDIAVDEVCVSTFRTAMAQEFQDRAQAEVTGELPEYHWMRTTHSACFQLLGLDPEQVVDDRHRDEVCGELGVTFDGSSVPDPTEDADWSLRGTAGRGNALGDVLFHCYSYCRNTMQDMTDAWRSVPSLPPKYRPVIGRSRGRLVEEFVDTYERYKDEHHLVDFDDMLEQVLENGRCPPVEVIIEDEFQDKSALQIAIHEMWAAEADRVYVAGDIYQAIYSFMGTTPEYMQSAIEAASETRVLDTSYRFGPRLWAFATDILTRADYDPPAIEPVGETTVERLAPGEYQDLVESISDDDALHLVRANYMTERPVEVLRRAGIPFHSDFGARWTPRMVALYNGTVKLRRLLRKSGLRRVQIDYGALTLSEVRELGRALRAGYHRGKKGSVAAETGNIGRLFDATDRNDLEFARLFDVTTLRDPLTGGDPFGTSVMTQSGIGSSEIRNRLRSTWESRGERIIDSITHEVTTIHGAKGRQADHVFLLDALPPRIVDEARPVPSADAKEARVFFVGATRAAKHLWIVDAGYPQSYRFPEVSEHP